MSATRSASGGSPYLKPKLMIVSVCRGAPSSENSSAISVDELMDVARRRVDDDVGALAHRREPGALEPDAVEDRAVALQRMRSAHRLESPDEHVVRGIQEHEPDLPALAQRLQRLGKVREQVAAAHVDDDGHPRQRGRRELGELEERPEHLRRQVVDDVPAEVFERVRRRRSAGPRHPGHDQHFAGLALLRPP